ncbi:MAG: hypothetical protein R6X02_11420 [Enhygromyxa sp.]
MSEAERDRLRERVASGAATGEERDRLAGLLARAIREQSDRELAAIEELIGELRVLADAGSDRSSCTDALAGALLDAQIRAFERRDAADAWRRLDEIRARLLHGGTPDLLHDRLAAALFNLYRGGELLADEPMRLAALEELRTRAYRDPSAAACRVALAELLADGVAVACRRDQPRRAELHLAELERLFQRDSGLAVARELARALRELVLHRVRDLEPAIDRLQALVASFQLSVGDPLELRFAELLTLAHADALRRADEPAAEGLREQLRGLTWRCAELRARRAAPLRRELGKTLHDAAVLGGRSEPAAPVAERRARALAELRALIAEHRGDIELRGQLMSALFQVHREAIEGDDPTSAEQLASEADALLADDEELDEGDETAERPPPGLLRMPARRSARLEQIRFELRLDHLRILLATHAIAGDRGDWARADMLLSRARRLVDRARAPLEMLEVFGQMLVNAHVDAGARNGDQPIGEQPLRARALLLELRELARSNPQSGALQLHLGTALFNAHVEAGRRRSLALAERLLAELDQLYRSHPGLLELRRRLVMALVNHHGDSLDREDFARASELLEQIRELARSPDADNHLRVQLAMALGNTLAHVDDPACGEDDRRIVNELRILASREDASDTLRALVLDELSDRFAPRQ